MMIVRPPRADCGKVLAVLRPCPRACAKAEHWRRKLKHHRHFERASNVELRETAKIRILITDLDRRVLCVPKT